MQFCKSDLIQKDTILVRPCHLCFFTYYDDTTFLHNFEYGISADRIITECLWDIVDMLGKIPYTVAIA